MQIEIIRKTELSPSFERWFIRLAEKDWTLLGYQIEAMDGAALHHRCPEQQDVLVLDISKDYLSKVESLINHLGG